MGQIIKRECSEDNIFSEKFRIISNEGKILEVESDVGWDKDTSTIVGWIFKFKNGKTSEYPTKRFNYYEAIRDLEREA